MPYFAEEWKVWQDNMNKTVDQTTQVLNDKKQELEVLDSALSGDAMER